MKTFTLSLAALVALVFASPTQACDFCMIGQGVSPYLTSYGRGLTLDVNSVTSDKLYDKTNRIDSNGKQESWLTYSLTGFYTVAEDFNISVIVPYSLKTNIDFDDGVNTGEFTNGLGDISVLGRYTFFRDHTLTSTWVNGVIAGLKLPTGLSTYYDAQNNPVDRHALPGTGSFDYIFGLSSAYTVGGTWQLTADIVNNFAGPGSWNGQYHRFGNSLNYALRGYYNLLSPKNTPETLFVFLGASGQSEGKETGTQTDDGYDPNLVNLSTGGTVLFGDVGIYSNLSANTILNLKFSKAWFHDMNFDSNFEADPAEDYKIYVALTYLF